jgi:hypothetical protein
MTNKTDIQLHSTLVVNIYELKGWGFFFTVSKDAVRIYSGFEKGNRFETRDEAMKAALGKLERQPEN